MTVAIGQVADELVVRSVLIPLSGSRLLLPNSLVAEVFGYVQPDPIIGAPTWLLGSVGWRGVALPLISFESLIGGKMVPPGIKGRVIVIYGIGRWVDRVPYIGLLASDVPRLLRASTSTLLPAPAEKLITGITQIAMVDGAPAWIPDIDHLVGLIAKSLPPEPGRK
jgi:chemosensory pili system protein ChpC